MALPSRVFLSFISRKKPVATDDACPFPSVKGDGKKMTNLRGLGENGFIISKMAKEDLRFSYIPSLNIFLPSEINMTLQQFISSFRRHLPGLFWFGLGFCHTG